MKKIAIVYYSMSGNTDYVAKQISKRVNADLIRLIPVKEYPDKGFIKFFWGGKSTMMKENPKLKEYQFDSDKYDYIVLATPVWASSFVPPIRTFIKENKDKLKNKTIAVIISYSGGGAEKAEIKLKEYLEIDDFDAKLILIDPKDNESEDNKKQIDEFCNKISK